MAYTKVAFSKLAWTAGNHPLERKRLCPDRPLAMLEFAPGFADPNWCLRSHVILVLNGTLELEFETGVEQIAAGECCAIDGGTAHRACNPGQVAVVAFIASEIELGQC